MTHTPLVPRTHADRIAQLTETRQRVLLLPAEQAMAAILKHPQPAALVHSFPEEELHFLIHDIGPNDALPLIALASSRQWEYLLDMETWSRDRLSHQLATRWLQLLLRADPDRLIQWCYDEKLEYLEWYLFGNVELIIREHDQSSSDFGDGFFTDDDTFYVRMLDYPVDTPKEERAKARRNEMLSQLLHRLSGFDHPRYQGLLLEAMSVIPAETEEELLRLRNVRLAEKGFLPFHEAIGVYQPLRRGDLAARGKKVFRKIALEADRFPVPQMATAFLEGDNLFVRALKGVQEQHVIQQLQAELANLCNQVASADQAVIRARDQLKAVVSKVSGYLGIGLERMTAKSDAEREINACALLQRHLLVDIFRTGFAGALQLKWTAARWRKESWFQSQQLELTFWDEMWLGLLGGLLIDKPKFFDPSGSVSHYREFQTRAELAATKRGLNQVVAVDQLLQQMAPPMQPFDQVGLLTYKNLLLTLWARAWLKMAPLDQTTKIVWIALGPFKTFFASLWTQHAGRRFIGNEKKAEFLTWAADSSGLPPADLSQRLGTVFEALFAEMEHELAAVAVSRLDPRQVHHFLIR